MADPIFAAFTDEEGIGPDVVALVPEHFPPPELAAALQRPELHCALHLVVHAAADEVYASRASVAMIGGALALDPESAAMLHRQLGEWLARPDVIAAAKEMEARRG